MRTAQYRIEISEKPDGVEGAAFERRSVAQRTLPASDDGDPTQITPSAQAASRLLQAAVDEAGRIQAEHGLVGIDDNQRPE